jgi:uncharacterized protein involved in outer membrane biogenesis
MNKTIRILIIALVVILVLSFAKDAIIKTSIEKGAEVVTGLRLDIQSLKVGILNTRVGIRNLKLYNPKGFEDPLMLNMPEIYVNYNLPAIISGRIHLPEVRIHMEEFLVIKNEDGELNLDALNVVKEEKGEKPAKPAEEKGKAPEFQIDELQLTVGRVIYKDYTKGAEPQVQEFDVAINEKYQNIDDPAKLVSLIVVKVLMNTSIARLANFDVKGLEGSVGDTLASAQEMSDEATKHVDAAQEAADEATKSAGGIGKSLKGLFGAKK